MIGKMYSSQEYAINAFRSKSLFDKIITCNVNNPTEKDFDSTRELYKVLWMAHYYMWDEIGRVQIIPLKTSFSTIFSNTSFLSFKVYIKKGYDNSVIWVVETNAPSLRLSSLIDLLVQKSQEMGERFKTIYGSSRAILLGSKLAGTSNRHMPLYHSSLIGDWIAVNIEDEYYPIISTRASIENELLTPSYSLKFYGNNGCAFGGEHPDALKESGLYDSNYNVIIDNNGNRVLAFVVSLYDNVLKVIHRYKYNYSGSLIDRSDNELSVVNYRRVSDLRRAIDY